jgi:hypothetical protein
VPIYCWWSSSIWLPLSYTISIVSNFRMEKLRSPNV